MRITRRSFVKSAAAAGLSAFGRPAVAQALPKLTTRVDFLPWGMHAGLHLGVDKGWFKEAGLDVEVSDGKGSGIIMQQVATGRRRRRLGAARRHGDGTRQRACRSPRSPGLARRGDLGALVPKGAGLTKVKDLRGQEGCLHRRHQLGSAGRSFSGGRWHQPGQGQPGQRRSDGVVVDLCVGRSRRDPDHVIRSPSPPRIASVRPTASCLRTSGINIPSYGLIVAQQDAGDEGRCASAPRAGRRQGLGVHLSRQDRRGRTGDLEAAAKREARRRHPARPDRRISRASSTPRRPRASASVGSPKRTGRARSRSSKRPSRSRQDRSPPTTTPTSSYRADGWRAYRASQIGAAPARHSRLRARASTRLYRAAEGRHGQRSSYTSISIFAAANSSASSARVAAGSRRC